MGAKIPQFGPVVLITLVGLVVASILATNPASATHTPRTETTHTGLSANETATLWSNLPNNCLTAAEYRDRHGGNQTSMQTLGNCTDVTFKTPPETAAQWSAQDFRSLDGGDSDLSVSPTHANRTDSHFIKDAHATIFNLQPSTIAYRSPNQTVHYVAPNGTFRGLIDYRVRIPADTSSDDRRVSWSLHTHEIEEIRLRQGDTILANAAGDQTPQLRYQLFGAEPTTISVEADITVTLAKQITETVGNDTRTWVEYPTDRITVSDTRHITVYNLTAEIYNTGYPSGDSGVAIYQPLPWHGYGLVDNGSASVRGVWRYYTARHPAWDQLIRATSTRTDVVTSSARPVYVRAYPSRVGPRADPIRGGPEILEVWGLTSQSPAPTIPKHVDIGVINDSYTRSYGLAVRYTNATRESVTVHGIVRNETGEIIAPSDAHRREIRPSNLTVTTRFETETAVTLRIQLRDASTGDPIMLAQPFSDNPRVSPVGVDQRGGYITIDDRRVRTNASGIATVTLDDPGGYTAVYHPGSWRTHNPAYVSDQDTIRWHPLSTLQGWIDFVFNVIVAVIPFILALYAGLKLGTFLQIPEAEDRYP